MKTIRRLWAILVTVKDALALVALLLFFGAIAALVAMQAPDTKIEKGSALAIALDGTLVDQASPVPLSSLVSGGAVVPETEAWKLARTIDRAAADPAISMITLDLDRFLGGGQANLEMVGAALDRFRKAGKKVESFATSYSDSGYLLAAHADRIILAPDGQVLLSGPGGSNLYFKDALDRLKVHVEVFRVGTYKSFVEPFIRNDSSPEAKMAEQQLADDLWGRWREDVAHARPGLRLDPVLANWKSLAGSASETAAGRARDAGLVDALLTKPAWRSELEKRLGARRKDSAPGDYKRVSFAAYQAARDLLKGSGPGVAIIHVAGNIVDGSAPAGTSGGDSIRRLVRDAITNPDVKAIVVRIDSGGGSVAASEEIRLALLEAKATGLPVVASFGPVAASGGYWVATAADAIYASPSTVTGSIGVFGIIPTFEKSLQALGISTDGIKTTELSGQPDILGGLNDPTRALIQNGVEDTYRRFLRHVANARKMKPAAVEPIAEGRVWSGTRAKEYGLIDGFGDLDAAIAEAGRRAHLAGTPRAIEISQGEPFLLGVVQQLFGDGLHASRAVAGDALAAHILATRMRAAAAIAGALAIANGPTIQASCLACSAYHPLTTTAETMAAGASAAAPQGTLPLLLQRLLAPQN